MFIMVTIGTVGFGAFWAYSPRNAKQDWAIREVCYFKQLMLNIELDKEENLDPILFFFRCHNLLNPLQIDLICSVFSCCLLDSNPGFQFAI